MATFTVSCIVLLTVLHVVFGAAVTARPKKIHDIVPDSEVRIHPPPLPRSKRSQKIKKKIKETTALCEYVRPRNRDETCSVKRPDETGADFGLSGLSLSKC